MPEELYHTAAASARAPARPKRTALAAAVAALALACATIAARGRIVSFAPALAPVFAAAGLATNSGGPLLTKVSSTLADGDKGDSTLAVEGEIDNPGRATVKVAALRVAVEGPDGQELYHWVTPPPKSELAAGESIIFRAKLDSPPTGAQRVSLRFAAPDDDAWSNAR